MSRVIRSAAVLGATLGGAALGFAIGGPIGAAIGAQLFSAGARGLLGGAGRPPRAASVAQLQVGEQPRQAILGRAATAGSLVDAFNYGGKHGTDWEVLVIALADHRCDALEGFFVDDRFANFTGDGNVPGFNNQLQVFWRSGVWEQTTPSILTTNGPGWSTYDRGRGVAYVVVAYKADDEKQKEPVWQGRRPGFRWVVRGLRCYQARKDATVGGSGAHRWADPATWEWTENPIDIAHNWRRGIYAGDRVAEPGMLLIGRGLSDIEAPPASVFARANICDETVGGQPRYRIGGVVASTETFINVESDFAAAVGGTISQPEGAVEVDPGEAKAPIAHFTDADLIVGSKAVWNEGILGQQDNGWINTVVARFVDPAQRWNIRSAPVRRDLADIIADGAPREAQPQLDLVTNAPQAQRIAEIIRRLGRLWGRAAVTLPPRFAFIEEGDWVTWQSDRRFGGATLTFQVEAWGSDKTWHHALVLRQISASVFSDTAPLDDGVIASDQPGPPVAAPPDPGAWAAAAVLLGAGSVRVPNLRIGGAVDDPAAQFVVFEYVPQVAAPVISTIWTFAANSRPDVTLMDIPVPEGGTFWVAVSYIVDGIQGARLVLGPITASAFEVDADGAWLVGQLPWSRTGGSGRPETFTFNSRGDSAASQPSNYADGLFDEAGIRIGVGFARSYTVHHRNIGAATWTSAVFDVFGDTAQATAMAAHLDAIASGAVVVVLGFDEPRENRLFGALPAAMYRCGASRSIFGRNNWVHRPAYALIGRAGIGESLGTEIYRGSVDNSPDSWISGTFSIVNGLPVVGFSPIRGAEDISYPNGFRLDELQPSEVNSDVTKAASGTPESTVGYTSAGVLKTGEIPKTVSGYKLTPSGGAAFTSGVTWSVAIISGSFTGAAPTMAGTGQGQLTLNSDPAVAEVILSIAATYNGRSYPPVTTKIKRVQDAPVAVQPSGSAFASANVNLVNSTTTFSVAQTLLITTGAGVTSVALTTGGMNLTPAGTVIGTKPCGIKWQRETSPGSGSWVDIGTETISSPHPAIEFDAEVGAFAVGGSITNNFTDTGRTGSTAYSYRLMYRRTDVTGAAAGSVILNGTISAQG